jgi:hypothetical protein
LYDHRRSGARDERRAQCCKSQVIDLRWRRRLLSGSARSLGNIAPHVTRIARTKSQYRTRTKSQYRTARTKPEIALAEIDRVTASREHRRHWAGAAGLIADRLAGARSESRFCESASLLFPVVNPPLENEGEFPASKENCPKKSHS